MEVPADLKYSEQHIWVRLDRNWATIGLTDFAQQELGELVYIDLPQIGDELKAGDPFGSVESLKSVTELYSPLSGKVINVNGKLADLPGRLNLSPYDSWIAVLELADPSEAEKLWDAQAYAAAFGLEDSDEQE